MSHPLLPPGALEHVLPAAAEDLGEDTARELVAVLDDDDDIHCAAHADWQDPGAGIAGCPDCEAALDAAIARLRFYLETGGGFGPEASQEELRRFVVLGVRPAGGPVQ